MTKSDVDWVEVEVLGWETVAHTHTHRACLGMADSKAMAWIRYFDSDCILSQYFKPHGIWLSKVYDKVWLAKISSI